MSEVIGFLMLAGSGVLACRWLLTEIRRSRFELAVDRIERVAYLEYRRNQPIDRVAVVSGLVGELGPRVRRLYPSPAETPEDAERVRAKALETIRAIGSVRVAEAMTACDEVTRPPFHTFRDFGDESPAA